MRILNYGSLNIDLKFSVPHIVRPGETIASSSLEKSAGGKGANQSAAIAKAGWPVFHAGKIGKDGLFLTSLLKEYGVDVTHVLVDDDVPTGQAMIQVDESSQNSIVLFGGTNERIEKGEIDATLSHFSSGDFIILQNEISNLDYIFSSALAKGMKIIFNPSPFEEALLSLPLDKVSILFVNEIEGAALAGGSDDILGKLSSLFPETEIVLTLGRDGACYSYKGLVEKGGIVDLPVVDTTGAGDTFTGYFLVSRLKGFGVKEALDLACKASSLAVSRNGAMTAMPFACEVFV